MRRRSRAGRAETLREQEHRRRNEAWGVMMLAELAREQCRRSYAQLARTLESAERHLRAVADRRAARFGPSARR